MKKTIISLLVALTTTGTWAQVGDVDMGTGTWNSSTSKWEYSGTFTMPAYDVEIVTEFWPECTKEISKYTNTTSGDGWYLIAAPVGTTSVNDITNLTSNNYDIYRFNQNPTITESQYLEWENWKTEGTNYHFDLEPGRGYLYANSGNGGSNVTLTFFDQSTTDSYDVTLVKSNSNGNTDSKMLGWNLIGNPFSVSASIVGTYYRINPSTHKEVIVGDGNITAMEGIFVHTDTDGTTVTFTKAGGAKRDAESNDNNIVINLNDGTGIVIDRAIIRFDKGETLPKFQLRDNSTKLYIPQDGKDYAIAFAYRIGELSLNFKAEETGRYTLSFSSENMNGVSLVDKIENVEIDMSVNDSYSFIGSTNDRVDRFALVFSSTSSENGIDVFAYQYGNDIVVNAEGELQIFDVMGRMVNNLRVSGTQTVEKPSQSGVYILRVVGETIRTQKIVVR